MNHAIALAIEVAGGRVALSKALDVNRQSIYNWEKQGYVPPARATQIERLFNINSVLLIKPELRNLVMSFAAKQ